MVEGGTEGQISSSFKRAGKNLLSFQASNTTYMPGKGKLSLPSLWLSISAWHCRPVSKTPTPDLQPLLSGCQAVRVIL